MKGTYEAEKTTAMDSLRLRTRSTARAVFVHTAGRIPDLSALFEKIACWIRFSRWCLETGSRVAAFDASLERYEDRYDLYETVIQKESIEQESICFLEFGVCNGDSILWWLNRCQNPANRFVGFDTFTGLPERWHSAPQGKFSTGGKTPKTDDARCRFEIGLFQDRLPIFLQSFRRGDERLVVHLDADLYSSTLYVLACLAVYLRPGDLVFFDEFASVMHEFRALEDFVRAFRFKYEVVAAVVNFPQVCLKVIPQGVSS